ncbi:hypothetical protein Pmani_033129 [Petrolisthes manimaculis]|uniref:Uncharacterized protein n=1 Tax=Petrolisthes manimaculis TaxID=1843537 RepID=A0AAE1TQR9_9EUCA|nr:hypothetical protein Pmani_033129 [Petrolisthes manimaculis]
MMNVKEVRQNEDIDGIENGHGVVQSETLLGDMQRKETNANENNITVCEKNARGLSNGDGSRGRKMEPREGKGMKMEMRENEGQKMEMRMRESDGKKIELRDSEERKTESSENEEMMKEEQLRDGGEEDEEGNWDADSNEKDWNKDEEQDKDNDDDDEEKETVNEQQPIAFEDVMELV